MTDKDLKNMGMFKSDNLNKEFDKDSMHLYYKDGKKFVLPAESEFDKEI